VLRWAFAFLIIALIAMVLGLPGVAVFSADIARILFFVFLVLFLLTVVVNVVKGAPPPA